MAMKLLYTIKFQLDEFDPNKGETLEQFHRRMRGITRRFLGRQSRYAWCKICTQRFGLTTLVDGKCSRCREKIEKVSRREGGTHLA